MQMELPDNLTGGAARAILLLKSEGKFTSETLGAYQGGGICSELRQLNWPVREIPMSSPATWEPKGEDGQRAIRARMQSRAFLEWEAEAVAAIAGKPAPAKPAPAPTKHALWKAADYTGYKEARLSHPRADSPVCRLFFALIHLEVVTPETAEMRPLAFVAAAKMLGQSGWPVELQRVPLQLRFAEAVPPDVIEAWRAAYGDREQSEALAGTIGTPRK